MSANVVLQSWKEISEYVGRTERTVQRWEQRFGFPVHRPSGKSRSSVMALVPEIHEWTRGKPSLVQIRAKRKGNGAKLDSKLHNGKTGADPNGKPSTHLSPEFAIAAGRTVVESRRFFSTLLQEQKNLRESVARLRTEQQQLCTKLRQTLSQRILPEDSFPLNWPKILS